MSRVCVPAVHSPHYFWSPSLPNRAFLPPSTHAQNPYKLLRYPVRLVMFFCAWVFCTTSFHAWQYGIRSCFFTSAMGLWGLWIGDWWLGLIVAAILLVWTMLATVPLYSLAVHTPSHIQASRMLLVPGL